jgi:DNA gyrase subunit A
MARGSAIPTQSEDRIISRSLERMMHDSMMPYAEYVILERALPRVEDGLKPVQRRILYTMYELGLAPEKPHRKSARIVGDCLGKYHPHGDTSVYDAMVRMAQPFNMREPLVDGHGNFGSMDGDSAAAMRYTEARLTPLAMEMLRDIQKETVDFQLNFDDSLKEPRVLPGRFPNLLVNGSSGIAVGLATNIPPHNLSEVINAVIAQMENPDITLDELMEIMPGPDFPTGGSVMDGSELKTAYETGRGKIIIRATVEVENTRSGKTNLVITELPYQVNKATLLEKILKLREDRKGILTGIADIRDESDREGLRAVIEVRKDADHEKILNYLYKYADLQVTFGINMVAIAEGRPRQLGLKEILSHYIAHQKDVVLRRTRFELEKAKAREHILEGLMIALAHIDEVIEIIKTSENAKHARERLMQTYELSEIQAQAILDMRLQKLTNLEVLNLKKEYKEIKALIACLKKILKSEAELIALIRGEMEEIRDRFATPRRSVLIHDTQGALEIKAEDLMVIEDVVVTLSWQQDIKRVPLKSFNRSQKDVLTVDTREKDYVKYVVETATNGRLLFMTDKGNCYGLDCYHLPEGKWKDRGEALFTLINGYDRSETVVGLYAFIDYPEDLYIQFYTQKGMIKRTKVSEYNTRNTKIVACGLANGDKIVHTELTRGDRDIMVLTRGGGCIRFHPGEMNEVGRAAKGIRAIKLRENDRVVKGFEVEEDSDIVVFTDRGVGKRTSIDEYAPQKRAGVGAKTIDFYKNHANGRFVIDGFCIVGRVDIVLQQRDGTRTEIGSKKLPLQEREAKGSSVVMVVMDNEVEAAYLNPKE